MPAIREKEAIYEFPRPPVNIYYNHINGRGNNLPLFTMIYIFLMPVIVYSSLFCFALDIFQLNFVLSIGFGLVIIGTCLTES